MLISPTPPVVRYKDQTIKSFWITPPETFGALLGVDLGEEPSRYELVVEGESRTLNYAIEVMKVEFGVEELTLPDDKVTLDEPTLRRVREEKREISASMVSKTQERLWDGDFVNPVQGPISGRFGVKRILNGEPRSPHSGEDFKASQGTAVRVSNDGRVVLAGDYFFSGRSVFIDHGLGLYTMYFHLSEIHVRTGDGVKKGEVIGLVGSTGRATGPHLHWGVRLNGARVNPVSVVALEGLPGMDASPVR